VFIPGGFETLMPRILAYMAGQSDATPSRSRSSTPREVANTGVRR
jgi:hypothetical protein